MNHDFTPPTEEERKEILRIRQEIRDTFVYEAIVVDHFNMSTCPTCAQEPVTETHLAVPMMGGVMSSTWSIYPIKSDKQDGVPFPKFSENTRFANLPETHRIVPTPGEHEDHVPAVKYYDWDHKAKEWFYHFNVGPKNDPTVWRSVIGDYYSCSDTPIYESELTEA
jgi:hypothetical protein